MRERGFPASEVCRLADVSYRQLHYWAADGLLIPSVANPSGSGTTRLWSTGDVLCAALLGRCSRAGVKPSTLRGCLDEIQNSRRAAVVIIPWGSHVKVHVDLSDISQALAAAARHPVERGQQLGQRHTFARQPAGPAQLTDRQPAPDTEPFMATDRERQTVDTDRAALTRGEGFDRVGAAVGKPPVGGQPAAGGLVSPFEVHRAAGYGAATTGTGV